MGIARTVGVLGSLLSLLSAQEKLVGPAPKPEELARAYFPLPKLGRYDTDLPEGAPTAARRLGALLERTFPATGKLRVFRVLRVAKTPDGDALGVHSTEEGFVAVRGVLNQLGKEAPLQVRLQCSLVTLPWSVAQTQSQQSGRVVAVEDETVGKLLREASKNKGTLRNLLEVTAGPLAPFYVESPRKPDVKEAETLRLRGEMLPIDDREVVISMHLVRGALPEDKTREPVGALLQPVFRLQTGKCALATVVEGDTATVLVVRCVDVAAKAPPVPAGR